VNIVEILVTAKNMTAPAFAEAAAGATGMDSAMSKLNKTAALGAAAVIGFLGESVNMASKFDSEMALLNTQAGVSEEKIGGLKKGVLALSGKVAQDPDSLADSLFHVESNFESMGITSEKALKLTETAAKGATVGHADLVDVTNALTAAVASGIPGVEDFDQAMGVLNATVGVGDMKMQDLANAFGSGMVATVKGFGLSITDVGAALAVFGDNNIRGSLAGNQLRMSVMALAKPISTSEAALKTLGLTQTTLAEDMQKGGLKLALEDLVARMKKAGISADQQGQVITDAFGRKAGAGLNVLVGQMDRLESKYPALEAGAQNFGAAWDATTKTFAFQMKSLEEKLNSFMIAVGEKLIPKIQSLLAFLKEHKEVAIQVAEAMGVLLAGIMAFSAISKIVGMMQGLQRVFQESAVAMAAYRARIIEVEVASAAAGGSISRLGAAFAAMGTTAKLATAATAIGLVVLAVMKLSDMGKSAPPDIDRIGSSLQHLGRDGQITGEMAKVFGDGLEKLGYAVDRVAGKASGMDKFNDVMNGIFTLGMSKSNSMKTATDQINSIDEGLANLVKSGHADLAAAAVKRLQDALAKQGKDPAELGSELHKYNDALGDAALMQKMAAESMGELGQQAVSTTAKLNDQKLTAEGLKEAISDLNDANRAALDGMAGFEAAIDAASKAVDENGRSLQFTHGQMDLTTEKARTEEGALTSLAAKTDAAALATLNNGGSMEQVNAIYDRGREKLITYAQQMGLNKEQARELADQILQTPDKTAQLRADSSDLRAKLDDVEYRLRTATGEKRVELTAEKRDLEAKLAAAQRQIDALHGKTITVYTEFATANAKHLAQLSADDGYAHGGIIGGAATGGPRSGMTWVGEQGPELVRLPGGSTVIPAGQSRSMAQAGGGGGAVVLEIRSGGSRMDDLLVELLRGAVRTRGGNVQTVLGK
jgi:TP901 family phage tail tape measure protein